MLRRCKATGMLRAVFLLFPLLLLLSLFPGFFLFVVSLLLLMFLFMRIRTTYICRRGFLSTEHFSRFVFVLLMFILVFSLRCLIYVSILFWQLKSYGIWSLVICIVYLLYMSLILKDNRTNLEIKDNFYLFSKIFSIVTKIILNSFKKLWNFHS